MMWFLTQLSWQRTMKYDAVYFFIFFPIAYSQLQLLWLEMQSKWSPFSQRHWFCLYFLFYEYLCGMSQLHGVAIPKCLLCDVPESCKLYRLSKFHSLTKNYRYPQVMIHDVPPLATLLQSLPVVPNLRFGLAIPRVYLEAQKYSDALKSYSRALENLKPFAGDDAWHRILRCCKTHLKNKLNKSNHPRNP